MKLKSTLQEPVRSLQIPKSAQWLSGEGAGSWFHIVSKDEYFEVVRYSPEGKIECSGIFQNISNDKLNLQIRHQFIHLSHCKEVRIEQGGNVFILKRF